MKKVSLLLVVLCLICSVAFAQINNGNFSPTGSQQTQGINDSGNSSSVANAGNNGQQQGQFQGIDDSGNSNNRNDNENRNTNTNLLNNDQDQQQGQAQGQGQDQGQGQAQGQAMGQGQVAVGKVNVEDNSEYKSYAFSPPSIGAQKGTETGNMYSIFGGVGLSQTEEYQIAIEKLAVIERMKGAGFMTEEEALAEAKQAYLDLDSASQPKRWLGVFGKTRGRHLLNVFGLLAWDSFYKEGQKPFSKSEEWQTKPSTVDENDGSGNEGYVIDNR